MKQLLKLTGCVALAGLMSSCGSVQEEANYQIIPLPQEIVTSQVNPFILKSGVKILYPEGNEKMQRNAQFLADYLKTATGKDFSIEAGTEGKNAIVLALGSEVENPESYQLKVTDQGVTITAPTEAGVFYGIQTLRKSLPIALGADVALPAVEIKDAPRFGYRGAHFDVSRHFFTIDEVKTYIDMLALHNMNRLHWHITDDQGWRLEIKKYPKLTEIGAFRDSSEINHFGSDVYDGKRHGGFYTQEDLKEIVDYAAKRHITIVPEVSMPGHASAAIASYPWLGTSGKQIKVPGKFGVHYEVFNVADPDVMKFLDEVTDEVIAIFPGSVFHIGGDEVKYDQWKNSPAIRAYMTKHNLKTPAELQVYFTNEISNMLAAKGKRMMGWNEITGDKLHEYQSDADTEGVKQELASGTIVHFWKGDTALIRKTIEKGYDVVNSYHEYTYLDYSYESIPMEKAYSFNPVPEGLTDDQKSKVLGLGCQMWGEFIPTVESMNLKVYPRLAAYAETGWTDASNKDYQRFLDKLNSFLQKWKTEGITCGPVQ